MGQTFHGGTDISGPLERALAKLDERNWQLADLLIASDGEFGATPAVAAQIRRAKDEMGLRIQGVLIGDRETVGFLEIADEIYWMRDWRRYGSGETELPGPTRSLTARYFAGALRTPDNRDRTVSGAQAAKAVAGGPSAPRNNDWKRLHERRSRTGGPARALRCARAAAQGPRPPSAARGDGGYEGRRVLRHRTGRRLAGLELRAAGRVDEAFDRRRRRSQPGAGRRRRAGAGTLVHGRPGRPPRTGLCRRQRAHPVPVRSRRIPCRAPAATPSACWRRGPRITSA